MESDSSRPAPFSPGQSPDELPAGQAARKVELIVAQLDSLPTLPRIAVQLLRLIKSDTSSTRQVIELVKQDQAVTAKILSLANRADSGIRGSATTIDKCVVLMGLEAVRNAALSIKVFEAFDPGGEQPGRTGFRLSEFWKHSLAAAIACEMLASRRAGRPAEPDRATPAPDELFVAGLLHDIGKPALHHCLPKSYDKVIEAAEATHAPLTQIERRLIGIDHTVVGKRLAQRWDLPGGVIEAIWLHHSPPAALPESVRQHGFVGLVQLADLLVRELRLGYSGSYLRPTDAGDLAAPLGLTGQDLDAVRRALPDELAKRGAILGLEQLDSRELYHQALTGANEELASLNAQLVGRTAGLAGKARCFELLSGLATRIRPGCHPIEALEQAAPALAAWLGPGRAVVFSERPLLTDGAGEAEPIIEGVVLDRAAAASQAHPVVERFSLEPSAGDVEGLAAARRLGWFGPTQTADSFAVYPLDGRMSWVHHRLAAPLPLAPCCLLPLLAEGRWVGGAIFSAAAQADAAARWNLSRSELLALVSGVGLAVRAAQLNAAHDALAEELTQAAELLAQGQEARTQQRTTASIGRIAAGAGHELNNPLAVISGRTELLAADEPDPRRRQELELIRQNAQRAAGIVTELMALAQPPPTHPQRIDLPDFARAITAPLQRAGIAVEIIVEERLPAAWADPTQLKEVVQEILDNAQQAMAAQDSNRRLLVRLARLPVLPGPELEISITDTGVGMDPTVLEHAGDPFFSARPAGRGRGLGLARARRLLEHNGGSLLLESQSGVGTTARIRVPAAR